MHQANTTHFVPAPPSPAPQDPSARPDARTLLQHEWITYNRRTLRSSWTRAQGYRARGAKSAEAHETVSSVVERMLVTTDTVGDDDSNARGGGGGGGGAGVQRIARVQRVSKKEKDAFRRAFNAREHGVPVPQGASSRLQQPPPHRCAQHAPSWAPASPHSCYRHPPRPGRPRQASLRCVTGWWAR